LIKNNNVISYLINIILIKKVKACARSHTKAWKASYYVGGTSDVFWWWKNYFFHLIRLFAEKLVQNPWSFPFALLEVKLIYINIYARSGSGLARIAGSWINLSGQPGFARFFYLLVFLLIWTGLTFELTHRTGPSLITIPTTSWIPI